jgi:hypothetical protein
MVPDYIYIYIYIYIYQGKVKLIGKCLCLIYISFGIKFYWVVCCF